MIMLSFRNKRDKDDLLEKARKMEEYASMIVECIEESKEYEDNYNERSYRRDDYDNEDRPYNRYSYNRRRM